VDTHHGGRNSRKPLAVVPNTTCGIAVGKAMELVGFVPQLLGKNLREQPSGEAGDTKNIVAPPVGKDALSLGGTQYTTLLLSAFCGVIHNTGARGSCKMLPSLPFCLSWSSFERWKW
jgi:hypothetical protein